MTQHSITIALDYEDDGVDENGNRRRIKTGYGRGWCDCGWVTSDADENDWVTDFITQGNTHLSAMTT